MLALNLHATTQSKQVQWNPWQKTSSLLTLTTPTSPVSNTLAQPQCCFWVTNCIGEGFALETLPKSKRGVWSCDKAHSSNQIAPFCILFERVRHVSPPFFFFSIQSGNGLRSAWDWEVLLTRTTGAERVKQYLPEQLEQKGLNNVYQNSWSWKGSSLFTRAAGRVKQCLPEQLGLIGLISVYQNSWD